MLSVDCYWVRGGEGTLSVDCYWVREGEGMLSVDFYWVRGGEGRGRYAISCSDTDIDPRNYVASSLLRQVT